jgi:hypothetical protein
MTASDAPAAPTTNRIGDFVLMIDSRRGEAESRFSYGSHGNPEQQRLLEFATFTAGTSRTDSAR